MKLVGKADGELRMVQDDLEMSVVESVTLFDSKTVEPAEPDFKEVAMIGGGSSTRGMLALASAMMAVPQAMVRMERRSAGLHPLLGVPEVAIPHYRVDRTSTISPAKRAERRKKNKIAAKSRRRNR